jgi:hypothetical protein
MCSAAFAYVDRRLTCSIPSASYGGLKLQEIRASNLKLSRCLSRPAEQVSPTRLRSASLALANAYTVIAVISHCIYGRLLQTLQSIPIGGDGSVQMSSEDYEFHIDAFTPSSIPMARLAQYISELASLLGNTENVHFSGIKKGSVRVVARVASEAAPKVRVRLNNARDPLASNDVRRHFKKIDEMLRSDNAVGNLKRGTSNVIVFPGRKAATNDPYGPFTEASAMDGMVVRVGGADETAHILVENHERKVLSAECTRDLAVRLAPHLYKSIRLIGTARWWRDETGECQLLNFRAKDFAVLDPDDLSMVVSRMRKHVIPSAIAEDDAVARLMRIRDGSGD